MLGRYSFIGLGVFKLFFYTTDIIYHDFISSTFEILSFVDLNQESRMILIAFGKLEDKVNQVDQILATTDGNGKARKLNRVPDLTKDEEGIFNKAKADLRKRREDFDGFYEKWRKDSSRKKIPQSLNDSINGLRNIFRFHAPKLNPIFLKCALEQVCPPVYHDYLKCGCWVLVY